jgi:hypothetical protein
MKSYLFIIYYINIDGLSQSKAAQVIEHFHKMTKIDQTYVEKKEFEIVQNWLPVMHQPTHVQFYSHPSSNDDQPEKIKILTQKLKSTIERYKTMLEEKQPINSFDEI